MKKLIVIKLGGSVVTDKDSRKPKAKLAVIERLGREIGQIYRRNKYKLIIVHGAGSFGHPIVKKYQLHLGIKSTEQKQALAKTQQQLSQLNQLIIGSLNQNGVPAVSLPPHTCIQQQNGRLSKFDYSLVKTALEKNLVPVFFGDMVPDTTLGYSVISGDTVVAFLAKKLKASQVIFLSDVDGVYTTNPKKDPKAKLIPLITNKNFPQVLACLSSSGRDDVSGEMEGKIQELRKRLKGVSVLITSGLNGGNLPKAAGQYPNGTKLRFD